MHAPISLNDFQNVEIIKNNQLTKKKGLEEE